MNYYRKTVNNTANDVKLKMQIGALTVKITENINKVNDLLEVDEDIKTKIDLKLINSNKENNSKNDNKIYNKGLLITSNNTSINDHKERLDAIEKNIKNIPLNSTEIISIKTNIENFENTIKNYNTDIIKIPDIENNVGDIHSNIKDLPNMKTTLDNVKYRQGAINLILVQLKDVVNDNSDNITNNYNISYINKKSSEYNGSLINSNTE